MKPPLLNTKIDIKKITLSIIILSYITILTCSQRPVSRAGNPVFPGWYADPEGIIFDDQYWIYPTYSTLFDEQVFMDAFSSPDLVNWTKHSRIIDTTAVRWVKNCLWAPAIVEKDGKYFLFFSANDIKSDEEYGGIGVGVADRPEGTFRDYLDKPLVDKYHNGVKPIDQFVFLDKDDAYYMYYGYLRCNVAKLNADFTGFEPLPSGEIFKDITPERYHEGTFVFVRNGKYYFMWSECCWGGPDYSVAYAIADNPFGPFQRIGKILEQDPNVATGTGHHSVIHEPKSDKYYIVYHRRPLGETDPNHRVTCIDEMLFDENGLIIPVKITHEGVKANKLSRKRNEK